ncbi:CRISPR-associated helicase Cas3' [Brevibacillus sp. FSL L8-0710]|uniref:CRISPR-associated helicase Cas3' n=1 Tax=Brevibacillus sp. FSL L8-0710 TaxID=2975313 RepID=UPI0030FC7EF3
MPGIEPPFLAKSLTSSEHDLYAATVAGHLEQVVETAEIIVEKTGWAILQVCQLEEDKLEPIKRVVRVAALLHDLGKLSGDFVNLIEGKDAGPQVVRHELLSCWMLENYEPLLRAVEQYIGDTMWGMLAVKAAILGHHLRFPDGEQTYYGSGELKLYLLHRRADDVRKLIDRTLGEPVDWSQPLPSFPRSRLFAGDYEEKVICEWKENAVGLSASERKLCSIIRGILIAADALGSVRSLSRGDWVERKSVDIRNIFSGIPLQNELGDMIQKKLAKVNTYSPEITQFQETVEAAATYEITVCEAGCGSGKTIAAYRWAKKVNRPFLCFAYPTTATATQGYADYQQYLQSAGKKLHHSRADIDFELLLNQKDGQKEGAFRALEHLLQPVTICTVDTVIGLTQLYYSSLCVLPHILQSAIVFDEIHSYDENLFASFLRFLKEFDLPILLMTASLQQERREALQSLFRELENEGRRAAWCKGPELHQSIPRYRLHAGPSLPKEKLWEALNRNENVLIIVNTTDRAMDLYETLKKEAADKTPGAELFCYHSRFKYRDRLARQQEIVEAFRGRRGICAITTQIAEMSFDVSCDVLMSEIAPFSAVIQRLGRLNRTAKPGDSPGRAYFWMPESISPYEKQRDDVYLTEKILRENAEKPLSQADLSILLATMNTKKREVRQMLSGWEELPETLTGSLRDESSLVDVIVKSDFEKTGGRKQASRSKIMEYVLPVNRGKLPRGDWMKWRHVYIVPDEVIDYDEKRGGMVKGCKSGKSSG